MKVNMNFSDKDIALMTRHLGTQFPVAIKRALLRAGNSGRAEMVKAIAADTGLPSKRIRENIRVNAAATMVQLEVTGQRIPLIDFRARGPEPSRGRGRGVSYKLPGGAGRVDDAFIATMPSGHRGVFKRAKNARSTRTAKGWSGLPIIELFGPSLVRVFEKFLPAGAARAREALVTNLRSEIRFALSRR